MNKKDRCKEIMGKLFGPASANLVEKLMDENNCVDKCRTKVSALLGADVAKQFDTL